MTRNEESLEWAVGQMIVGGFSGESVPSSFVEMITQELVGGAILFARNVRSTDQVHALIRQLTALRTATPLLISVDQEGGRVERLKAPFPELPSMRRFGQTGRRDLAHKAGLILGQSLRILGFHQNYAPSLDVDSNPKNPVIGDRSFSSDPQTVAELGVAMIEGLQSAGIAACGKHFPGHGDTETDSHLALPVLPHNKARLEAIEFIPFRAAIKAKVAAMMTSHIVFPSLDSKHPATLSEHIIEPLLRQQLGYDGLIVSDDLEMNAIMDHYGIEEAVVRAARAGCDQLLICHRADRIEAAHSALVAAVKKGVLAETRVREAAHRVTQLKKYYAIPPPASLELSGFPLEAHQALLHALSTSTRIV